MKRRLSSGVTSFAEVVNDLSIETLCIRIAESLELFGSINIQLRLVEGLGPMVFEINPRFSSTVGMRHAIGFSDLIWSIEEQYLAKNASPCPSSWPNVRFGRRYHELIETR
jgi:carbamoyl-phosphate synthase large subunit